MSATQSVQEAAFRQNSTDYFERAVRSAKAVLPHVIGLIRPSSVVDFGCGGGAWLKACGELGIADVLGVDGQYVDPGSLAFPRERFLSHDLRRPLDVSRRFDLAISLEVAEHIPSTASDTFVDSLVRLAPVVLFSAAIPYQGGIGHVNEQWPTYWRELFDRRGYVAIDFVRRQIWNDDRVDTWYRQNIVIYAAAGYVEGSAMLRDAHRASRELPLDIVHPKRYLEEADPRQIVPERVSLDIALQAIQLQLKRSLRQSLHWRLQRLFWPPT